jgi:hypothetical protein
MICKAQIFFLKQIGKLWETESIEQNQMEILELQNYTNWLD